MRPPIDSPTIVARPTPSCIQKRREVARIVGHVVLIGSGFGQPVAALVVSDDAEIRREDFGDLIPDAEVRAEGIDEDERRPVAAPLVG